MVSAAGSDQAAQPRCRRLPRPRRWILRVRGISTYDNPPVNLNAQRTTPCIRPSSKHWLTPTSLSCTAPQKPRTATRFDQAAPDDESMSGGGRPAASSGSSSGRLLDANRARSSKSSSRASGVAATARRVRRASGRADRRPSGWTSQSCHRRRFPNMTRHLVRLYDYPASCNCYKVRLLLAQLGVPYERIPIDIFNGETLTDEYARINPMLTTPVLETEDGRHLSDSNAIFLYLAQRTGYLPDDAFGIAQAVGWLIYEQTDVIPTIGGPAFDCWSDGPALRIPMRSVAATVPGLCSHYSMITSVTTSSLSARATPSPT